MSEAPQQYVKRILSYVAGADPLRVQRATPTRLKRLITGLTAAQLRWRPEAGKWSIVEIIAHLSDAELVIGYRMRLIVGTNGASLPNFDQDFWVASGIYARLSAKDSLDEFTALRVKNLRLLALLPRRYWRNFGVHSERGRESLAHIIRLYAGHDRNHIRQIEGIRSRLTRRRR